MPARDLSALRLSSSHLKQVKDLLAKNVPDAEVWAYGSRVTGTGHEASDLDLVLRNPANLETQSPVIFKLREAFVDSNLPIHVDVMDWARLPGNFRKEIARDYVIVKRISQ